MATPDQELLRHIPKIDVLLSQEPLRQLSSEASREELRLFTSDVVNSLREHILAGETNEVPDAPELARHIAHRYRTQGRFHLKRVVNATGIVLHTNLGRAPLGDEAANHIAQIARGYSNLEFDLESGRRGSRYSHVEELLCELTGAEAACVVNNDAAAVFLMLDTLCKGCGVAISRGELVEIGGSFRVPDIMERSGALLVEVGTTNKTHPADYEVALAQQGVSALLKVHTSNFVMSGFVESVSVRELARIASEHSPRPLILYDAGAGLLDPGANAEPMGAVAVRRALAEGADLVSFSGDKLAGSAQGGIVVGRRELVDRLRKSPFARMFRIDKLSLAALEMTLRQTLDPRSASHNVPTLRMLSLTRDECWSRANELARKLGRTCPEAAFEPVYLDDEPGGGSLPGVVLPGAGVAVNSPHAKAERLEQLLRQQAVPVVARVRDGRVLISVRTLLKGDDEAIVAAFTAIAAAGNL